MFLSAETPKAEIEINDKLIQQLIQDQHPDFSHLSILRFEEGWDNVLYRLGNQYVMRLPRRQIGAELIQNEITWLPMVAHDVQYATPQPVRIGHPQKEYPWSWVIVPWIEGVSADFSPPQRYEVDGFVQFLKTIHQPAPDEAPENATRGISLSAKAKDIGSRMDRLRRSSDPISDRLVHFWKQVLNLESPPKRFWIHGDLHPRNIIVFEGKINGIIDWGDITSGDVATDLASIWMLFDDQETRQSGWASYGGDEELVMRSMGWAIFFGVIFLEVGKHEKTSFEQVGRDTLRRVEEDMQMLPG